MRKSYRFLAASLIACLFSIAALAQTITVSGVVRNSSSKESVPAVSVVVKGTSQGTYTNSDGEFSIKVAKLPVVLVFSSAGGYDNYEVTVNDAAAKIDVELKPNVTMGQEVVVATTRTPTRILEAPVTVERLGGAALRSIAAPNYYEAISNLKGVDMHTASLTFRTVTTRGFISSGNTRLNQLIDGMDNQAPGLNFSVGSIVGLTELDVDNIELLSGASSALYGSGGMNGTLLLTSKNPFKYQGLSYNIKQGIMHVDGKQRAAAPFYDWSMRWGKAIGSKWAFKIAGQLTKGSDWQADDYRNKQQIGVLSKVVGGNRSNDPNFNGINIYGDEASANMNSFAQLVVGQTRAAILPTGLDVVSLLNSYFGAIGNPVYPTNAQLAGFYTFAGFPAAVRTALQNPAIMTPVNNMLPFYNGVRNGYFQSSSVSRTGYEEKALVDYNTLNVKLTGGLHYKINNNIEASINSYFGTGTTVYTGADRYSLRNLKIAQHKLEVRGKTWFVRGYTTQENAGESYNATAVGVFINSKWKANSTWFPQYIGTFSEGRRLNQGAASDMTLHAAARAAADQGRLIPGTAAFNAALKEGRSTPIKFGGGLFLDKSDLWAGEGQLNLSDALSFSDKLEIITGVQWKQWVMNSQGTLFADNTDSIGYTKVSPVGNIKINETGGYIQLRKKFLNEVLTLTAAGRYDKQTNFEGRFTPRFTAVIKVAKDNNIRLSYQQAYRFPTNQNQYISLITGAGALIGCLPEFQDYYKLNSTRPGYTAASILAYRAGGNPLNTALLQQAVYKEVKPETVSSYELGYKGIIEKRLFVDAYVYYSVYKDFLATIGIGQSNTSNPQQTDLFSPFTTGNVSYTQNSTDQVKAIGWGIGMEYQFIRDFIIYGNVFSDELKDVPSELVTFFNAPKYRVNIGVRNENVYRGVGFNVVAKWQDNNYYEGTFVTGTLPYFTWVDAQITYRPTKSKSVWRLGGTNIGNNYYRTGFGSPYVGGLYYISYGWNIF
ncbi:MAG: carboxypeptidase-like regulatory domain-containing protein [Chitinophagaceae bacterium]|nr:carboxypeptidase-like regulatory domain-containing protein [Chitinophagaceae bacterium]